MALPPVSGHSVFLSLRTQVLPAATVSIFHVEMSPAPVSPRTWVSFSKCFVLAGFFWVTMGVLSTAILSLSLASSILPSEQPTAVPSCIEVPSSLA